MCECAQSQPATPSCLIEEIVESGKEDHALKPAALGNPMDCHAVPALGGLADSASQAAYGVHNPLASTQRDGMLFSLFPQEH